MADGSNRPDVLFGVVLDALINPFQRNIAKELIQAAENSNARLIFFLGGRMHSGQENEDRMSYIYRLISKECVDGLILLSSCLICDRPTKLSFVRMFHSIPIVNIGSVLPGMHNILIDNSSGIRQIVHHLIEFHHAKEFAFVGGIENNPDAIERYQVFQQALTELHVPFDPDLHFTGNFEHDSGIDAVHNLWAKGKNIDTVVAANDDMAIGVMDALHQMGKRIPQDVRVTGFDNIPDSGFCIPGLTTAGQPFARMARQSIESLLRLLDGKPYTETVVLPTDLISRQSCGCYPAVVVDYGKPAVRQETAGDGLAPSENIIRNLLPEYRQILTEDRRTSIFDLVRTFFLAVQEGGEFPQTFLIQWNELIDEILVQSPATELLERLLMEIHRTAASCEEINRGAFAKMSILLQNAWYALLKKQIMMERSRQFQLERDDIFLQYFRSLTTLGSSAEEVIDPIRYFLPRMGIRNFFLAKFENLSERAYESARMIMHQCQDPDVVVSKDPFPSDRLIPGGIRSLRIGTHWIVGAISLHDEIGFIILEMSTRNLLVYSQIRTIVSSGMQEYLLFRQLQEQAVSLQNQSKELTQSIEYLRKIMGAVIQTLSMMVEAKDPYTAGHERRVADLARSIAADMGLPFEKTEAVRLSSVVHDIGKLYIPSEILNKPAKLLDAELSLIKLHPKIAFDILKNIEFPWPLADIVYQHHERCDGSGYPRGLVCREILLESRIIAVADVVEAMASHRPYRPSRGIEAALKEISDNRGIKYDSEVVDTCLKLFRQKGYTLKE